MSQHAAAAPVTSDAAPAADPAVDRRRELLGMAALLVALLAVFFGRALSPHRVLSPADLLLLYSPWRHDAPPGFLPGNALLSDYVLVLRPWRTFAMASLRAGTLPLWDPHNYAGAPLVGNGQSAVFFPLNLPFLLLPEAPAVLVWVASRLLVAGLLTYALARVLALTPCGATFAALAYTFSGFLVVWLLWPHASVAIWLPGLLLATELLVRRPAPSRVVALAAVTAVQFLGGHPETSLHVLAVAGLFAVWRAAALAGPAGGWRTALARLGAVAGAMLLGAAGAAIQLLPLAEYVWHSAALAARQAAAPPSVWTWPAARWLDMLSLVCPYCFGSWRRGDVPWGDIFGIVNFNELNGGYVGLATLVLAGVALALGPRRGVEGFFAAVGALAFGVAFQLPLVSNLVQALPLFRVAVNFRLVFVLAFALALLGGRGVDRLVALPADRRAGVWRRLRAVLTGIAGAMVAATAYVAAVNSPDSLPAWLGPDRYDRFAQLLVDQLGSRLAFLGLAGLAISLALRRRWGAWALPAVLVLDLFAFGRDYTPAIPRRLDYPGHPAIAFLQAQPRPFRFLALDGQFPPNVGAVYGLEDVRGYNVLESESYLRLLDATGPYAAPAGHVRTMHFSNYASRLVDLLNVRYVLSDRPLDEAKLALVFEGHGVRVYENRAVLPRAFLASRVHAVPDLAAAERAVRDPAFDPATTVVVETPTAPAAGPPDPDATARIAAYTPNRVTIDVATRAPAVLLLADAWFPGWEATVDGAPVPLWRADLALRAVPVPAGSGRVVFTYRPLAFRLGLALTGLAVVVALVLLLAPRLAARRPMAV